MPRARPNADPDLTDRVDNSERECDPAQSVGYNETTRVGRKRRRARGAQAHRQRALSSRRNREAHKQNRPGDEAASQAGAPFCAAMSRLGAAISSERRDRAKGPGPARPDEGRRAQERSLQRPIRSRRKKFGQAERTSCPPRIFDRNSSATTEASAPSRMICGLMKRISSVRAADLSFDEKALPRTGSWSSTGMPECVDVLGFLIKPASSTVWPFGDRQFALHPALRNRRRQVGGVGGGDGPQ